VIAAALHIETGRSDFGVWLRLVLPQRFSKNKNAATDAAAFLIT
jgi:hypothetical protein